MLAKQVLSQLSYTPTVRVTFILKHFSRFQNPFPRILTVFHVAQECQPGGTTGVLSRQVVMGENPSNYVFVDLDVESQGDLLCDSRTTPVGITLLHFDDRMKEF